MGVSSRLVTGTVNEVPEAIAMVMRTMLSRHKALRSSMNSGVDSATARPATAS